MNKNIKKIDDNILNRLFKKQSELITTNKETDENIINFFNNEKNKINNEQVNKDVTYPFFNYKLILSFTLMIILFSIGILYFYINSNRNITKTVNSLNGESYLIRNEYYQKLKTYTTIQNQDSVITKDNSECKIQYNKNIAILIDNNTKVNFSLPKNIHKKNIQLINLINGTIYINYNKKLFNKKFIIETPLASITAIGTQYIVEKNSDQSLTTICKEGKLKIKIKNINKNIILNEGFKIKITQQDYKINNIKTDNDKLSKLNELKIQEIKINRNKEINQKESWFWKNIYKNQNIDNTESSILNIFSNKDYVFAQSPIKLICFSHQGNKIWEIKYGENENIYFKSKPVLYKDKIFLSTLNKLLIIIDAKTGNEIKRINTGGNISFGYSPVIIKNQLLLPYRDGIYTMDLDRNKMKKNPIIKFNNSKKPVISNNLIILSSFINNNISAYDLSGNIVWTFFLDHNSYNIPNIFQNHIYISDNIGNIYKIDMQGNLIKKNKIKTGIISNIIPGDKDHLFILANDGYLYQLGIADLQIKEIILIDKNPDDYNYLYKNLIKFENMIITGSSNGDLIFFDINKKQISEEINIAEDPIISQHLTKNNVLFIGTKTGNIYLIKKFEP